MKKVAAYRTLFLNIFLIMKTTHDINDQRNPIRTKHPFSLSFDTYVTLLTCIISARYINFQLMNSISLSLYVRLDLCLRLSFFICRIDPTQKITGLEIKRKEQAFLLPHIKMEYLRSFVHLFVHSFVHIFHLRAAQAQHSTESSQKPPSCRPYLDICLDIRVVFTTRI